MAQTTPLLLLPLLILSAAVSEARVPKDRTFRSVNEGETGFYPLEYMADYRFTSAPGSNMFNLVWFNTTPDQFYLGLRMGITRSESPFRIVWEANRGRPVGENATLTFSSDGNLVLAEADGRVVWSTGTANKGVVDFKITQTGNIILPDKKGRPLWQSFDHPTDTLLVGQSLRSTGPTRLVSRNSREDNSDGAYSLVLERREVNFYISTPSKRYRYANFYQPPSEGDLTEVTFDISPYNNAYDMIVRTNLAGAPLLSSVTFNATFSILRLEMDGNLVMYSYYDPMYTRVWKKTYSFFVDGGDNPNLPACSLPSKCGGLGLCEDGMCVGCPTAKGTVGWSRGSCIPSASSCMGSSGPGYYYKLVGVEQFIPVWNEGEGVKVKVEECRRRCTGDCRCNGFFYWEESSTCWLAPVLGTLRKVDNASHVAYIKYSKA